MERLSKSLPPVAVLSFANQLSDPQEKEKFLDHCIQRPWSEEDQAKATLCALGLPFDPQPSDQPPLEQVVAPSLPSCMYHFVVEPPQLRLDSKDCLPGFERSLLSLHSFSADLPKSPPKTLPQRSVRKKRRPHYPPLKQYSLEDVFSLSDAPPAASPDGSLAPTILNRQARGISCQTYVSTARQARKLSVFHPETASSCLPRRMQIDPPQSPIKKPRQDSRKQ